MYRFLLLFLFLNFSSTFALAVDFRDSSQITFEIRTGKSSQQVKLALSITEWDADFVTLPEVRRGVYRLTLPTPWVSELLYKFVIDGQWISDPGCRDSVSDGLGGQNCRVKIGFRESVLLADVDSEQWLRGDANIENHHVVVLRPPFSTQGTLPTVYFQDGGDYLERARVQNFLANYYKKSGIPFLAVLVSPADRMAEYGSAKFNAYDKFLSEKLISLIERQYRTGGAPHRRLLIGPSMGGLATLRVGLHAKAFGFIAPQSGSFWYIGEQLATLVRTRQNNPKIYSIYGFYEGEGIVESNEKLKSILEREGLSSEFTVTPSQHDWFWWRNQFEQIFDWYAANSNIRKSK